MPAPSTTRVSRFAAGYLIRVAGRGTLKDSPAVHAFARLVLDGEPVQVVIDLTDCLYLDSTFLGALVDLHRRYGDCPSPRLLLRAPVAARQKLLAPNCLDGLFHYTGDEPERAGPDLELPALTLDRETLGRHVLECHRRLLEIGGPNQAAIQGVVDRLSAELLAR